MVEYTLNLNSIFASLADPTRRDILRRVMDTELTVGQLAQPYDMSFSAVSKHLKVLEKARLVIKRKQGNEQLVQLAPEALADVDAYLEQYRKIWEARFGALESVLEQEKRQSN